MRRMETKEMTLAAALIGIAVVGSAFSVPVFGARCAPMQHMVNILCAVLLGPRWGVAAAFSASVLRNMLGLGTLLAFPGSMCGALLAGIFYQRRKTLAAACMGEVIGTGLLGGLLAYPLAVWILGNESAALFTFVFPFLVSTLGGTFAAAVVLAGKSGVAALLHRE